MLEDSRSMDVPPSSAPRSSPYDMAAWAAAAAAQAASTAASRAGMGAGAGMGASTGMVAADIGAAAFNMRHQWGWGMNSLSPFHVNASPGAWGLLGSDGVGSSAVGDARGAGTNHPASLGGLSGLTAVQQWLAMQQGSVARGLNGSSSSSQSAALAPGPAEAATMEQNQAGGAKTPEGDAKLGSGLPASFNLAEAMKQGASASGISDGFPALRNQFMRNAAAADAAARNAGGMQQPRLVSDAVLAVAAAAASAPLPMLSGGQGPMGIGDNLLMQQWNQHMMAMQNPRHGWDQQLVAQQQLSQQQQVAQQAVVGKHEQATPQQEHEAQQQQPLSQQQKRGRAQEQQSSAGHGSNANKSQVRVRLSPCRDVFTAAQGRTTQGFASTLTTATVLPPSQREANTTRGVDLTRSNLSDDLSDLGLERAHAKAKEAAAVSREFDGCGNNDPGLQGSASQSNAQAVQQLQQHQQLLQQHMQRQMQQMSPQLMQQHQVLQYLQMHHHQKQQQFIQAHQQLQQQQRRHLQQLQDQQTAQNQDALQQQVLQSQGQQQLPQQSQPQQADRQQPPEAHHQSAPQGPQQPTTPHPRREAQYQQAADQHVGSQRQPTRAARELERGQQPQGTPKAEPVAVKGGAGGPDFMPHIPSCGSLSHFSGGDADLLDEVMNSIFENSGEYGDGKSSPFSHFLGGRSGAESSCGDGAESSCGEALRELASNSIGKTDAETSFSDDLSYGSDSAAANASDLNRNRSSPGSDDSPASPLDSADNSIYLGLNTNDLLDGSPVSSRPPSEG